jgi:hypothetical protein
MFSFASGCRHSVPSKPFSRILPISYTGNQCSPRYSSLTLRRTSVSACPLDRMSPVSQTPRRSSLCPIDPTFDLSPHSLAQLHDRSSTTTQMQRSGNKCLGTPSSTQSTSSISPVLVTTRPMCKLLDLLDDAILTFTTKAPGQHL